MQTLLSRHQKKLLFKLVQLLFFRSIPTNPTNLKFNHAYGTLVKGVFSPPQYVKPKRYTFFTKYQHIKQATLITSKDPACTTESIREKGSNFPENLNENIIKVLNELAEREKDFGDVHRERAYRSAVKSISAYPKQITSGKEAKNLRGIGEGISKKIDEIIETGTCSKLKEDIDQRKLTDLFMKLPEIGKKSAQKLIEKGYKSLEEMANDPEITPRKKFGIRYISEFDQDAPREEMDLLNTFIVKNLISMDKKYMCTPCGSFRRGAIKCRELKILITHTEFKSTTKLETIATGDDMLKQILDHLKNSGFCTDYMYRGSLKFSAICQLPSMDVEKNSHLHRWVEFRILPYEQYWLGVLARTGNAEFYRLLQKKAVEDNYILNESTFARKDPSTGEISPPILVTSEKDIFDALDLEFIHPFERNWKKDDT